MVNLFVSFIFEWYIKKPIDDGKNSYTETPRSLHNKLVNLPTPARLSRTPPKSVQLETA